LTPKRSMFLQAIVSLGVSLGIALPIVNTTAHANPLSQADSSTDAAVVSAVTVAVAVANATVVLAEPQPAFAQPQPAAQDHSALGRSLVVTATAFNSLVGQTDSDPTTAAWGDSLSPGMKVVAVSRDLIPLGLDHRAPVSIDGLPGKYRVLDKMNRRWSKRIDIYMGEDVDAAMEWGRREVQIHW
jgi:3D (Asp-Asp-Asp) domain-containing protein